MPEIIKWGMIGCGDVTELKSGPAFNKVPQSMLMAVMSRSAEKAKDYATRHQVPKWFNNAQELIDDPEINAIYIATPPASHEELTVAALKAGKSVYVEKPMAINAASSNRMLKVAHEYGAKLTVAHYRREQPVFKKIKSLLEEQVIGDIKFVTLQYLQPALTEQQLADPKIQWRIDPAIAGGGLFHDIAPHQLDLMLYFFGAIEKSMGIPANQHGLYSADDMVSGIIKFKNDIIFNGTWCFSVLPEHKNDFCEIIGSKGKLSFPVFGPGRVELTVNGKLKIFNFEPLKHVQQPMIEATVQYFLNKNPNPCTAEVGVEVMQIIDQFTEC